MLFSQLYTAFSYSLRWNAVLFFVYKVLFTTTSFLLFSHLSVNDFSMWANLYSIIYLLLLWVDFGFRKSVPRYSPLFEKTGSLTIFLKSVLTVQAGILAVMAPVFVFISTRFFDSLGLSYNKSLLLMCAGIFFVEGINATVKLFYHAQFWNKRYTLIQTVFLFCESVINLSCILFLPINSNTLVILFSSKLVLSCCNAITSVSFLTYFYKNEKPAQTSRSLDLTLVKEFVVHSGMMWFSNSIKSITERNFLVPFITHVISPASGNLYKIANDWALLIHRPIVKTIGSSDTALLAHVYSSHYASISTKQVSRNLLSTIILICVPFCCIIPILAFIIPTAAVCMFLIMSSGYILETMLSPYERYIEVTRHYTYLFTAYLPYLLILFMTGYYLYAHSSSLIFALICLHTARLSGSVLMIYFSHNISGASEKSVARS